MNNWKKISTAALATMVLASSAVAQDKKEKPSKDKEEKTQEIVIRKKPGKTEKMTIVVDGDNATINGKPVDEVKKEHDSKEEARKEAEKIEAEEIKEQERKALEQQKRIEEELLKVDENIQLNEDSEEKQ